MKLQNIFESLQTFQQTFGAGSSLTPRLISEETAALRFHLMAEENEEYLEACQAKDLVGIADALGDQLYILAGTIVEHGMQDIIGKVFREIHASNMSKLDENGNPIVNGENGVFDQTRPLGKILKSENYFAPKLEPIVNKGIIAAKRTQSFFLINKISQLSFLLLSETDEQEAEKLKTEFNQLQEDLATLTRSLE